MKNTDEKKAKKSIDIINSFRGTPGANIYVDLADIHKDFIKIDIWKYGKKILSNKINMMNLSEMVRDDLMDAAVLSLFQ